MFSVRLICHMAAVVCEECQSSTTSGPPPPKSEGRGPREDRSSGRYLSFRIVPARTTHALVTMSSKSIIPFTSPRWQRLNEGCFDASDNRLTITSGPNTDWWRTSSASEPEASVNRHSGPVVYIDIPQDETHWKAGVWISGDFTERFQQATLLLGAGDYEASNDPWIKAGVELEHGIQFIG